MGSNDRKIDVYNFRKWITYILSSSLQAMTCQILVCMPWQKYIKHKKRDRKQYLRKYIHYTQNIIAHYDDVIKGAMASQISNLAIVYSTVYSGADQRKHQSYASLAFVWGIHRGPVNSPHKWPVTRKTFPFDDVIMIFQCVVLCCALAVGDFTD